MLKHPVREYRIEFEVQQRLNKSSDSQCQVRILKMLMKILNKIIQIVCSNVIEMNETGSHSTKATLIPYDKSVLVKLTTLVSNMKII